jgi:hypothetical protein
MTQKISLKSANNIFGDALTITKENLTLEQDYNTKIQSGLIENHIDSGILLDNLTQKVLFNSSYYSQDIFRSGIKSWMDGLSDSTYGNQLEITLSGTNVGGNRVIKIAIFGYDLNQTLIVEYFYFRFNETQISKQHFTLLRAMIIDDWKSDQVLIGSIVVKEAKPLFLSKNSLVLSQNIEPSIFFRDFTNYTTILNSALLSDNWTTLFTTLKTDNILLGTDINTQIGEKFLATSDNLQKLRLLLKSNNTGIYGNITLSIYPLQTTINNPLLYVPQIQIEYDPDVIPAFQAVISLTLDNLDYQPVSFDLNGIKLIAENYYIFTIKNTTVHTSNLYIASSQTKWISDARKSTFSQYGTTNEGVWTDDSTQDLWFELYADSLKITDGKYYTSGIGTSIDKHISTSDYCYTDINSPLLSNKSQCSIVASLIVNKSILKTDPRTGQKVYIAKQSDPLISIKEDWKVLDSDLLLGRAIDTNSTINLTLTTNQTFHTNIPIINNNEIYIINYDTDLNSYDFINSQVVVNVNGTINTYSVDAFEIYYATYGDVNLDGKVDKDDINLLSAIQTAGANYWTFVSALTTQYSIISLICGDVNNHRSISSSNDNLITLTNYVEGGTYTGIIGSKFKIAKIKVSDPTIDYRDDNYNKTYHNIIDLYSIFVGLNLNNVSLTFTTIKKWNDGNVLLTNLQKYVPQAFRSLEQIPTLPSDGSGYTKLDILEASYFSSHNKVDLLAPNNLIVDGQILNSNLTHYKVDFETSTITLYINGTTNDTVVSVDIFNNLVVDSGNGFTNKHYPALKFADGTTVKVDALLKDQVRFSVSIESYVANDPTAFAYNDIAADLNHNTGVLNLNFKNLVAGGQTSNVYVSKLCINVYLKKSGFNNTPLVLDQTQTSNLLGSAINATLIPSACAPACAIKQISTVDMSSSINVSSGTYLVQVYDHVIQIVNSNLIDYKIDLSNILFQGREIVINNPYTSTQILTILPGTSGTLSITINGYYDHTNLFTLVPNRSVVLVYDGISNWEISANFIDPVNSSVVWGQDLYADNTGEYVAKLTGEASSVTLLPIISTNKVELKAASIVSSNTLGISLSTLDSSSTSNDINLFTGNGTTASGNVAIYTGGSNTSGNIGITTGDPSGYDNVSGNIGIFTGNANTIIGNINIATGNDHSTSTAGSISIHTGGMTAKNSGEVNLYTGNSTGGQSGSIHLLVGAGKSTSGGFGGDIQLQTGTAYNSGSLILTAASSTDNTTAGVGGSVTLSAGSGFTAGNINVTTGTSNLSSGNVNISSGNKTLTASGGSTGIIEISSGTISSSTGGSRTGDVKFHSGSTTGGYTHSGHTHIYTGDALQSGNLSLYTGIGSAASGNVLMYTGTAAMSSSGSITINTGDSTVDYGTGSILIKSGNITNTLERLTGDVTISSGSSTNVNSSSGEVKVYTGSGKTSGKLSLYTSVASSHSGEIDIYTGVGGIYSGQVSLHSGNTTSTYTGNVFMYSGNSQYTYSGNVDISTGSGGTNSGAITIKTGAFANGNGGGINLYTQQTATSNTTGSTGSIVLASGALSNAANNSRSGNVIVVTGETNGSGQTGDITFAVGRNPTNNIKTGNINFCVNYHAPLMALDTPTSKLSFNCGIRSKVTILTSTSDYSIVNTDHIIIVNDLSLNLNILLPGNADNISSPAPVDGDTYIVKSFSTNAVTVYGKSFLEVGISVEGSIGKTIAIGTTVTFIYILSLSMWVTI